MIRSICRHGVLILFAAATLMTAGSASAAGWLAPVEVSVIADREASQPDMAIDAQGNAVAVWIRESAGGQRMINAATRPVGGQWSEPVVISPGEDTRPGGEDRWQPHVAVDPQGNAVAVWSGVRSGEPYNRQIVRAASLPYGGTWSAPIALSDPEGISYEPTVVLDAEGTATALWSEEVIGETKSVIRTRSLPRGGAWGPSVDLTDSKVGFSPQLAVDPQGTVTAVWVWRPVLEVYDGILQSKTRSAAGTWSTDTDTLSPDPWASNPRVVVDPQGNTVVVWQGIQEATDGAKNYIIQAVRRSAGSSDWTSPVDLTGGDTDFNLMPEVAVDPQGNATAVWTSIDAANNTIVRSSQSTAAGDWSAPVDLSPRGFRGWGPPGPIPQVTVDPAGNATAVWDGNSGPQTARRESGGDWSDAVTLPKQWGAGDPQILATDAQGYVTVFSTIDDAVRSSVFDPVAPELRDIEVPTTGVAGQPVNMSVSPFDVWSAVSSSWDFGDDGFASGQAVSHCYSSPGERTVTITGTDLAANATRATRTITIASDPNVAPGVDPCADPGTDPGDPGTDPGDPGTDPGDPGTDPRVGGGGIITNPGPGSEGPELGPGSNPDPNGDAQHGPGVSNPPTKRPRVRTLELRHGKLTLHRLTLKRTRKAKTCPKTARATVRARVHRRTIKTTRTLRLKKTKTACQTTATIRLKKRAVRAKKVTLTITGKGLKTSKRTVRAR